VLPRLRVLVVSALLALGGLVALPGAAYADDGTSVGEVVQYGTRQTIQIGYQVTVPVGVPWKLTTQLYDPNGRTSQGPQATSAKDSPTSGSLEQSFFGSEPVGTWTVKSTLQYGTLVPDVTVLPDTTFTVRKAVTGVALTYKAPIKRNPKAKWKVVALVRQEGQGGMFAPSGPEVRLERLVDGQWKRVRQTVMTVNRGRATVRVRLPARTVLRGVVVAKGNYDGSESKPITLRRS
jgi:hypothetical protein